MRLERKGNRHFPNDKAISNRGNRSVIVKKLIDFCKTHTEYNDVGIILKSKFTGAEDTSKDIEPPATIKNGYVYLIRAQAAFKIGCTRAPYRRAAEIANQSASGAELLHLISTDDPEGIEKYWHARFSEKRLNGLNKQSGEWFALTAEDVKSFKRRKFM